MSDLYIPNICISCSDPLLGVISESKRWVLAGSGCLAKSGFLDVNLKGGFE